jgi:hypothetical protein
MSKSEQTQPVLRIKYDITPDQNVANKKDLNIDFKAVKTFVQKETYSGELALGVTNAAIAKLMQECQNKGITEDVFPGMANKFKEILIGANASDQGSQEQNIDGKEGNKLHVALNWDITLNQIEATGETGNIFEYFEPSSS